MALLCASPSKPQLIKSPLSSPGCCLVVVVLGGSVLKQCGDLQRQGRYSDSEGSWSLILFCIKVIFPFLGSGNWLERGDPADSLLCCIAV